MTSPRKIGRYYSVGGKKHMMLLGIYDSKTFAAQLKEKKKRQGYTVATRRHARKTEVYIRQD